MKKFIIKSVIFITIFITFIHFFLIRDNAYLKKKKKYEAKFFNLENHNVRYVFLGDSHADGIPQEILADHFYDFSFGPDGYPDMYLKLLYTIAHEPALSTVVLSTDYQMFLRYREYYNNKSYIRPFADDDVYNELYNESYVSTFLIKLAAQFPIFDPNTYTLSRRKFFADMGEAFRGEDEFVKPQENWMSLSKEERIAFGNEKARSQIDHELSQSSIEAFHKIIDLCQAKNIDIIGIQYPLTEEYRSALKKYDVSVIDDLLAATPFTKLLDYKELLTDPKHFNDPDHFNFEGAKILLERLYKDIGVQDD